MVNCRVFIGVRQCALHGALDNIQAQPGKRQIDRPGRLALRVGGQIVLDIVDNVLGFGNKVNPGVLLLKLALSGNGDGENVAVVLSATDRLQIQRTTSNGQTRIRELGLFRDGYDVAPVAEQLLGMKLVQVAQQGFV